MSRATQRRAVGSPRPETLAMAKARPNGASATAPTASELPADTQVLVLKALCRHLWDLLERRHPKHADEVWGDLGVEEMCMVDRCFEAMLILWQRDHIHAEPCRRILDIQRRDYFQYLLLFPGGDRRVVSEEQLLALAGIAFDPAEDAPQDVIPFEPLP
ncbi:hypothetical protein BH09PSE4_BH09PSE4_17150 [soil metagenome]